MKTRFALSAAIAGSIVFWTGLPAAAQLVLYDNSDTPLGIAYASLREFGDQVILDTRGAPGAVLDDFFIETYVTLAPVRATVRIYNNDGIEGMPGTLLWTSPELEVGPAPDQRLITLEDLNLSVRSEFTWTISYANVPAGGSAGLAVYSAPSVGRNLTDFWERGADGAWRLRKFSSGVNADFGATITGFLPSNNTAPVLFPGGTPQYAVDELGLLEQQLLVVDADLPAQTLTFGLVNGPEGLSVDESGRMRWVPTESQGPGSYTVTVSVTDGEAVVSGSFTVVVHEVNQQPVLEPVDLVTVAEETPLTLSGLVRDEDDPPQSLTFTLIRGPEGLALSQAGVMTWTPPESAGPGLYEVTYEVSDGTSAFEAILVVRVLEVNHPPQVQALGEVTVDELAAWRQVLQATDVDLPAQSLQFGLLEGPAGLSLGMGGELRWIPTEAQGPSTNRVRLRIGDGVVSVTNEFRIVVREVPTPPVLAAVSAQVLKEGTAFSLLLLASDPDLPSQTLVFNLDRGPEGLTVDVDGVLRWIPTESQGPGVYEAVVRVTDGGLAQVRSVALTVTEENLAPVFDNLQTRTVAEQTRLQFQLGAQDDDRPAQVLRYSLIEGPVGLEVSEGGDIVWTPGEADGPSSHPVSVRVSDGQASSTGSFTVVVTEVNRAPVPDAIPDQTVTAGTTLALTLGARDPDLPVQTLGFGLLSGPEGMTLSNSGALSWTPAATSGSEVVLVRYRVSDGGMPEGVATNSFSVQVVPASNVGPQWVSVPLQTVDEESLLSIQLAATHATRPVSQLSFRMLSGPVGATVSQDGRLAWVPTETDGPSQVQIHVAVSDGELEATGSIGVDVREVNQPPAWGDTPALTVSEGRTFEREIAITDPDLPAQKLAFGVVSSDSVFLDPSAVGFRPGPGRVIISGTLKPAVTGTFPLQVRAADESGAAALAVLSIRVEARPPQIVSEPTSTEVLSGDELVLRVVAEGTSPLRYQWFRNGEELPFGTAAELRVLGSDAGTSGEYRVRVSNSVGEVVSAPATVTVQARVQFVEVPVAGEGVVGEPHTFRADARSSEPVAYQWFRDGVRLEGATNAQLTLTAVRLEDKGWYSVEASVPGASLRTDEVRFVVAEPPTILSMPTVLELVEGGSGQLEAFVLGTAPIQYRWLKDGVDLAGESGTALEWISVSASDEGLYTLIAANRDGQDQASIQVGVAVPPVITSQTSALDLVEGMPGELEVTATGSTSLRYEWRRLNDQGGSAVVLAGGTNRVYTISTATPAAAGVYQVRVSNAAGEALSAPIPVRVLLAPRITGVTGEGDWPAGTTIALRVSATGEAPLRYQWFRDGQLLVGATSATLEIQAGRGTDSGSYAVSVANDIGAALSQPLAVRFIESPSRAVLSLEPEALVATGTAANLVAVVEGTGPFRFQWYRGAERVGDTVDPLLDLGAAAKSQSGWYTVHVSNSLGETQSEAVEFRVMDPPRVVSGPEGATVAEGSRVVLSAVVEGDGPFFYQWLFNGELLSGATESTYVIPSLRALDAGVYSLVVSNAVGVAMSESAVVQIQAGGIVAGATAGSGDALPSQPDGTKSILPPPAAPLALSGSRRAGSVMPPSGWVRWFPPVTGVATMDTVGSDYDTVLRVYRKEGTGWLMLAEDDDSAGLSMARVVFDVTAGAEYAIQIIGYDGATGLPVLRFSTRVDAAPAPRLKTGPAGANVTPGSPLVLRAEVHRVPDSIQWLKDGVPIPGATGLLLDLGRAETADVGVYAVLLANGSGTRRTEVRSAPAVVTVGTSAGGPLWDKAAAAAQVSGPASLSGAAGSITVGVATLTREIGEPLHGFLASPASVWMTYQAPGDGYLELTGSRSLPEMPLAVYRGSSIRDLVLVRGRDTTFRRSAAGLVLVPVQSGVRYLVAADHVTMAREPAEIRYRFVPAPRLSIAGIDGPLAAGGTVVLTARWDGGGDGWSSGSGYYWLRGGVLIPGANRATLPLGPLRQSDSGLYQVVAETPLGTWVSEPVRVEVATPMRVVTVDGPRTVVAGSTASWTIRAVGSGPVTYRWWRNGVPISGAAGAQLTLGPLRVEDGGEYEVRLSNALGETRSAFRVMVAGSLGQPTVVGAGRFPEGSSVVLTVTGDRLEGGRIQWFFNGQRLPGRTGRTLRLDPLTDADAGGYGVEVSNGLETRVSRPVEVLLTSRLRILSQPVSQRVAAGSTAAFSVLTEGGEGQEFQWFRGDAPLMGATSRTLRLPRVGVGDAGLYRVVVRERGDAVTSDAATLEVLGPPRLLGDLVDRQVEWHGEVEWAVVAESRSPVTYQWLKDGVPLWGADGPILRFPRVTSVHQGRYQVVVRNAQGATYSREARLTLDARPRVALVGQRVTEGGTLFLRASLEVAGPATIRWFRGGVLLPGAASETYLESPVTPRTAGEYRVEVAVSGHTPVGATAEVTVNRAPVGGEDALFGVPGEVLLIPASNLLANDQDPDGSPLSLVDVFSDAGGGTVTVQDGILRYRVTNARKDQGFFYLAADAEGALARVSVRVSVSGTSLGLGLVRPDLEGGPWTLRWRSVPGVAYCVERSVDLKAWQPYRDPVVAGSALTVLPVEVSDSNHQFFRVVPLSDEVQRTRVSVIREAELSGLRVQWGSIKGVRYRLESSVDWQHWTVVGATVVGTGGMVDSGVLPETGAARFFRVQRLAWDAP